MNSNFKFSLGIFCLLFCSCSSVHESGGNLVSEVKLNTADFSLVQREIEIFLDKNGYSQTTRMWEEITSIKPKNPVGEIVNLRIYVKENQALFECWGIAAPTEKRKYIGIYYYGKGDIKLLKQHVNEWAIINLVNNSTSQTNSTPPTD